MKYPHLFSPLQLGKVTYRNRIFASPTGLPMVIPPEYLKRECTAFYELRAQGGAAVVALGDGIVHTPTGLMHPYKLRLDDPNIIPSLSNTARAIRQHGAIASLELSHGGKYANVSNLVSKNTRTGLPPYGPDHEFTADGTEILEMPEEIIETIIRAYGEAAAVAKMCGFGMVIVHGGHGWLLHQFMSPNTNHRTDQYGGSRENRLRLPLRVLDSIRAAVGPGFPIEFRMSGAEFTPGGYDIDEGVEIARLLAPKVDLLHVSAGVHDDEDSCVVTHPSMFHAHGCNVWLAERIKKAVDVPVATVGGLNDPAQMEEILASGKADVIEMSRALTADPFLPRKAAAGEPEKITKCIRCFLCLNQTATKRNIRCAVNPVIGRELDHIYTLPPVPSKKVLVVGGGPAGMEAALTAARRGHRVTLCEAEARLGGQLLCEEFVPFKQELFAFCRQKAEEVKAAGVEIRCNTRVTRAWAEAFAADVLVCAVGAEFARPPVPGIDLPHVRFPDALRSREPDFGRRVVVIGGGMVGCETAIHLMQRGHTVTVLQRHDTFAADATIWHRQGLRQQLQKGVTLLLNTEAVAITGRGVVVKQPDGSQKTLEADTVFCAAGLRPRAQIREELRFAAPSFHAIGDCMQPAQMFQALSQGHFVGRDIT
ncbi:MAG: FAD-dependent oxidoreductase [Oscillospiraceae bacterium]|nr:FAD-dependent oxidoreductase [Oscillospiraceae bacterium]